MSVIYCQNCGHKNLFSLTPPRFCGQCGEPFDKKIEQNKSQNKKILKKSRATTEEVVDEDPEIDPDESDIDYVPDLTRGLEYDIEIDKGSVYKGSDFLNVENENQTELQTQESAKKENKIRRQSKRS